MTGRVGAVWVCWWGKIKCGEVWDRMGWGAVGWGGVLWSGME